ncbi:MAG TPA: cystatin domain-containing protein [Pyrinomonadaceae bacterium]|nr:cystatin domain-containing protein [Pyrinomonadaceae bacterium]
MKIKLSIFALFIALFIILGGPTASFGQTEQIVGGYGDADVKDKEVISAATFAVKKGAKKGKATITLLSINKAQMQVVAGLNYELCLEVNVKKSKKSSKQFVKTVVYRDLKNRYSLTSWMIQQKPDCQ